MYSEVEIELFNNILMLACLFGGVVILLMTAMLIAQIGKRRD